MYAKSTRPSAKREVQNERSAKHDDRIARPRRAQTCERSELRAMIICPRSGQIFLLIFITQMLHNCSVTQLHTSRTELKLLTVP